jgi:uncharacterized protein YcbK (DUF882 family)
MLVPMFLNAFSSSFKPSVIFKRLSHFALIAVLSLTLSQVILVFSSPRTAYSFGEVRTLKLYHTHTRESAEITFKRNGRYDRQGLKKLNHFLRDWRNDKVITMDPALFDLVWEVYQKVGAKAPIHIVSSFRSKTTNAMLRRRSSGVAKNSQHTQGKAMDFFIPGVSSAKIREMAMRLQHGGVGYYPRSVSEFVHLDTGGVRHWPRMTRKQLARLFPNGQTVHIPSDGKPLQGYAIAKARLKNGSSGSDRPVVFASRNDEETTSSTNSAKAPLLAMLFNRSSSSESQSDGSAPSQSRPEPSVSLNLAAISAPRPAPVGNSITPEVPLPAEPVLLANASQPGLEPSQPSSLAANSAAASKVQQTSPDAIAALAQFDQAPSEVPAPPLPPVFTRTPPAPQNVTDAPVVLAFAPSSAAQPFFKTASPENTPQVQVRTVPNDATLIPPAPLGSAQSAPPPNDKPLALADFRLEPAEKKMQTASLSQKGDNLRSQHSNLVTGSVQPPLPSHSVLAEKQSFVKTSLRRMPQAGLVASAVTRQRVPLDKSISPAMVTGFSRQADNAPRPDRFVSRPITLSQLWAALGSN